MFDRLTSLYELQLIDDKLDELEELRGDLPNTVNELNLKLNGFKEDISEKEAEKKEANSKRKENEKEAERLKESQKKFKAQLYQVRNNKEYDALTKEIDHAEDQISKLEAENQALEDLVQKLVADIEEIEPQIESLKKELKEKEADLKEIIKVNEKEEAKLKAERSKIEQKVKKSDYSSYMRIRKAKGGRAVATIVRSACSGCNNVVPPQRQLEIKQNKRLYSCEYCGRILVSGGVVENAEDA